MTKDNDGPQLLLVYASQTGQSKAIAEEFCSVTSAAGLNPDLNCMSGSEKSFSLEKASVAVIVTSTTGDGEPPDTALRLWRRLKRATLPPDHLAHLSYSLLGLGDSNYNSFCNFGKSLDKRLQQLGAKQFYPSDWADDAIGLDVAAEPWMDGVLAALKAHFGVTDDPTTLDHTGHAQGLDIILNPISVAEEGKGGVCAKELNDVFASAKQMETLAAMSDSQLINASDERNDAVDNSISIKDATAVVERDPALMSESVHIPAGVPSASLSCKQPLDINEQRCNSTVEHMDDSEVSRVSDISASPLNIAAAGMSGEQGSGDNTSGGEKAVDDVASESLTRSIPPLSTSALTLPLTPPRFLRVKFHPEETEICSDVVQNGSPFSGAVSAPRACHLVSAQRLTRCDAVKTALELQVDISACDWTYAPGDTIGVVCPNDPSMVDALVARLGLSHLAHVPCSIELDETTKKKNAAIPDFIPARGSTLHHILMTCCEIMDVPRKVLLRALADAAQDAAERRRLQELCSKQGTEQYTCFVRAASVSLLDLLHAFPSCAPPIDLLLEHFPRLLPRPYSVASSLLSSPHRLRFVFNIIEIPAGDGRHGDRQGVCTGWLNQLTNQMQSSTVDKSVDGVPDAGAELVKGLSALQCCDTQDLESRPNISIFLRRNLHFHLPGDLSTPIVMIGPGTGIASFVGFLHHRKELKLRMPADEVYGQTWLFYGCRHRDRDYLYRDEMEGFLRAGVLAKLSVCFSRDDSPPKGPSPRHVQHNLIGCGEELVSLIDGDKAVVYVCGDARGMAPEVLSTFKQLLIQHKGLDAAAADAYLTVMRIERRYLEDIWT